MSLATPTLDFDSPGLCDRLQDLPTDALDALPFGVIGFDAAGHIARYNRYEVDAAMFERDAVIGQHVFVELAPCFNNYLIAGRFDEAAEQQQVLDESLPYVLSFRMRPTRVRLRLLADPALAWRFVLVLRS